MTASALVDAAAPGSPAALLVLIAVVLAAFVAAGGVLELLGRLDDRAGMAAGREARRHADQIGDEQ